MKKFINKKYLYIIGALFIFGLFSYITKLTPLAGDDWGYALNGMKENPISSAISFYFSWSGRFFSELWGFIVAPRKWLWNILNPLLFTGIFICVYKLSNNKKVIFSILFIIAFMLSVDDHVRMETYSWIMGTTYVVPLFLSLVYFVVVEKLFVSKTYSKKIKILNYLSNVCLFITGLMMENIAAVMVGSIFILLVYAYFKKKEALKYLIIHFVVSTLSFIIMRASPGSAYRLANDHTLWQTMSLFEKISQNYPTFLQMSFINNNYAIALFSISTVFLLAFTKKKVNILYRVCGIVISTTGVFCVFSFVLGNTIFNDNLSPFSMIFWPVYVINAFVAIFISIEDDYLRNKTLFFLIVAGASVVAMLFSPIFGSRSALYLIYYLIIVSLLSIDELEINRFIIAGMLLAMLFIIFDRTKEYIVKYKLVNQTYISRLETIQYYKDHPDVEEAWIIKMPIYSVHGADIEPGDFYHFETFKEYYGLPQSADKIIFYYQK